MTRRVLADTNVLISAFVFPGSVPDQALHRILSFDRLVLTRWVLAEFDEVIVRNWPDRAAAARSFIAAIEYDIAEPTAIALRISDPNDQPVLEAAIADEVDIVVTGDKRFFALGLVKPRMLRPRQYLDLVD